MAEPAPIAMLVRPGTYFERDPWGGYTPVDPKGADLQVESAGGGAVWISLPGGGARKTGLSVRLRPCANDMAMVVSASTDTHYVDEAGRLVRKHDTHGGPHDEPPAHLWPCGCLPNDAGAHRVGCPEYPEGVPGRG